MTSWIFYNSPQIAGFSEHLFCIEMLFSCLLSRILCYCNYLKHVDFFLSYQMHPVASSAKEPAVVSVGGALRSWSSKSSVCGVWTVVGSTPGQFEWAVVGGVVVCTLRAQAGGGVLCCHGDQVVFVVPGLLLLLCPMVSGVLGRATVRGARGIWGLGCQAALLLVVHEGLLVAPGDRGNHLLLPAVRCTWRS